MQPDMLLAGPRGRRLCLELAVALDDRIRSGVFWRSHEREDSPGPVLTAFSGGWSARPGVTRLLRPVFRLPGASRLLRRRARAETRARAAAAPSLPELARLLEEVGLPGAGPSAGDIETALMESVGAAMYWQPPHGTDVLAGDAELAPGLRRIADWLAPAVPGWWTAVAPEEQWTVAWWGRDAREAGQSVDAWREHALAEEDRARRERPADPTANWSGTWWSFPDGVAGSRAVGAVPVVLDLEEDLGGADEASVHSLRVPAGARILEIDRPEVWAELCRAHPLEVTASRRHDWYRVTGRDGRWVIPDWAAVAERWDGVHLTVAAYLAGATRAIEVDDARATVIAGWAPDATHWLTPVEVGEGHAWTHADDAWRPTA